MYFNFTVEVENVFCFKQFMSFCKANCNRAYSLLTMVTWHLFQIQNSWMLMIAP